MRWFKLKNSADDLNMFCKTVVSCGYCYLSHYIVDFNIFGQWIKIKDNRLPKKYYRELSEEEFYEEVNKYKLLEELKK